MSESELASIAVRCPAPCGQVSRVACDVLRLPDATIFHDIPKKRRLVCSSCVVCAREIEADWSEAVAVCNGKCPVYGWVVAARSLTASRRGRRRWGRVSARSGSIDLPTAANEVLRIEGPSGNVTAEDVEASRRASR